ncbi:MAG: DUF2177 family protein [Candidatus Peribacteraceae bacterium]|nr:DUF2177 family protein [Candidatus Peribacteraceae bacterium]
MTPTRFLKGFILSFVLFTLLDAVWHAGLMADFYNERLAVLNPGLGGAPGFSPFILFLEAVNAAAITYFVLRTASNNRPLADGAMIGAILGFTVISSVNVLNHALIPGWDTTMVVVDTAWGTASGLVVGIGVAALCIPQKRGWFAWMHR